MITEDLDKYADELRFIDEELAENNMTYPITYVKSMWHVWDTLAKQYYAKQLHCNVEVMMERLEIQQHKCCSCGRRFDYVGARSPVLGRLKTNMPFSRNNIRFRCVKCCHQNSRSHNAKFDIIEALCVIPLGSDKCLTLDRR